MKHTFDMLGVLCALYILAAIPAHGLWFAAVECGIVLVVLAIAWPMLALIEERKTCTCRRKST